MRKQNETSDSHTYQNILGDEMEMKGYVEHLLCRQLCVPIEAHIMSLFCELDQLPVCFQVQFQVLILIFKVLHSIGFEELPLPSYIYLCHHIEHEAYIVGTVH